MTSLCRPSGTSRRCGYLRLEAGGQPLEEILGELWRLVGNALTYEEKVSS